MLSEIEGVRLLEWDGPLASARDASDIIGEAFSARPDFIVIGVGRLGAGFLDLKTGLLGEVLQKFVNYEMRVVILGDVSAAAARSKPLRDFIGETNRGRQVWFMPDKAALAERLKRR